MGGQHDTQQRTHGTTAVRETKDGRETVKGTAGGEEEESGGERGRSAVKAVTGCAGAAAFTECATLGGNECRFLP